MNAANLIVARAVVAFVVVAPSAFVNSVYIAGVVAGAGAFWLFDAWRGGSRAIEDQGSSNGR